VWRSGTLHILARDEERRKVWKTVKDFLPWFYIRTNNGKDTTIMGERVNRFYYQTRPQIYPEEQDSVFEYDVSPEDRYLIMKEITHGFNDDYEPVEVDIPFRRLYFDLEMGAPFVPDVVKVEYPICCIPCYDPYTEKYYVFVWREDLQEEIKRGLFIEERRFKREVDMLNAFLDFIQILDFDILIGYNSDDFDFPYLFNRCKLLGVDYTRISPFREAEARDHRVRITGRHPVDLLRVYKGYHFYEVKDTSLDAVAFRELGIKKEKVRFDMETLWKQHLDKMIAYAIKDVTLTLLVDVTHTPQKVGLTDLLIELRKFSGVIKLDHLYSGVRKVRLPSLKPVSLLIRKKFKDRLVFPSTPRMGPWEPTEGGWEGYHYEGTPPMEPVKGRYRHLAVFDFQSLHPSIIIAGNISYDTLDSENGDLDLGGFKFRSSPPGVIPQVLKDLIKYRLKYKQAYKDTGEWSYYLRDFVVKRILLRYYGAMAYPGFFLFRQGCADATAWVAREIVDFTKQKLKEIGYDVIYGATDSVFVPLKREEDAEEVVEYLNKRFGEFCEKHHLLPTFKMEVQRTFESFFIGSKKNKYFGITDGKLHVMGYEEKKADTSTLTEVVQRNVMYMILRWADEEEVTDYILWEIKRVKAGYYPPTALGFRKGLGRSLEEYKVTPQHVRAMQYSMQNLGLRWSTAEKPMITYVLPPRGYPETDVIAFFDDLPPGFKVDYNRVIEKFIIGKIEDLYADLGWDINKVKNPKQVLLERWTGGVKTRRR